ncbi:hypothetical protein DFH11DRAFT_1653812 [Phellopilus nigrolimitatus]|nr:hypothetical protein DFH11DRAFT_1653812 [Phellopilus nigrolimitatus]
MYAGYSASSFFSSVSRAPRIRAPSPSMQFYHFIRILVRHSKHLRSLFFLLRLFHFPQHFGHHRLLRRYRLPDRKHGILVFRALLHLQRRLVQLDGGAELEVSIRSEALDVHVSDVQGCRRDLIAHFVVREPEHELALVEYSREFEELAAREQDPEAHGVARRVVREADVDGHVVESLQRLYEHRGRGCKRAGVYGGHPASLCICTCTVLPLHCTSTELQSYKGRLCPWHLLLGAGLSACVLLCITSRRLL